MTTAETAYERYTDARRRLREADLDKDFPLGDEVPHNDPTTIQLVVDRYVIEAATGERTGIIRVDRGRPLDVIYRELFDRLNRDLADADGPGIDEYFEVSAVGRYGGFTQWPTRWRWIACYAVTGGSEGHYIHVDIINPDGEPDVRRPEHGTVRQVFLGKTFKGMAHAQRIAARCAELLGA